MTKAAFISIVGRPSSGKSTFINQICGNKVSIVSSTPQTTRNKIRGIYTKPGQGQLIFIDTPGFNISNKLFNNYLKQVIYYTLGESDFILYMIDTTRKTGDEESAIMNLLKEAKKEVIVALNKIDQSMNFSEYYMQAIAENLPNSQVFPISALTNQGIKALVEYLLEKAPQGEMYYPEEYYTDQLPDFRISEIIREKAINLTRDEVPHSIYVEILDLEMKEEGETMWARAVINVERDSQKGIMIGKDGNMIRTIKNQALDDLLQIFPYKIDLDLRVKVDHKWRKNERLISRMLK